MSALDVRIVELPPMRVACAHGYGQSPELEAIEKMGAFMASNELAFEDVRWFGFNNPDPSPGTPNYGYDVWITVGPEVEPSDEIAIHEFSGGLYAVTRFKDVNIIGQVWKQLVHWREDSPYQMGHHQWLENLLVPPDTPYTDYSFDLYLPIVE